MNWFSWWSSTRNRWRWFLNRTLEIYLIKCWSYRTGVLMLFRNVMLHLENMTRARTLWWTLMLEFKNCKSRFRKLLRLKMNSNSCPHSYQGLSSWKRSRDRQESCLKKMLTGKELSLENMLSKGKLRKLLLNIISIC